MDDLNSLSKDLNESLKNLLLVSKADGMFDIVSKRTNQDLWTMTFAIVENLAPGIKNDIAYALEPPNEEDDKKISEKLSAITTEQEKTQGNTENIDMNDKNEYKNLYGANGLIHLAWQGLQNYDSLIHSEKNSPNSYRFIKSLVKLGINQNK